MADTAAFFAKKKKGKKKIKSFNANKVDVSSVSSAIHVDAPPIASATYSQRKDKDDGAVREDDEWASVSVSVSVSVPVSDRSAMSGRKSNLVSELLDMSVLEERRREEDDIAERMQVEETRMALAKAREGMEKEAQRLKEEQEAKEKPPSASAQSGGKWIPPHLRNSKAVGAGQRRVGSGLDTGDEEAFPDLAAANAEIERQKMHDHKLALAKAKKKHQESASYASAIKESVQDEPPWKPLVSSPPTQSAQPPLKDFQQNLVIDTKPTHDQPMLNTQNSNTPHTQHKTKSLPGPAPTDTKDTPPVLPPQMPLAKALEKPPATEVKKKKKKKKDISTFKPS